MLSLHTGYDTAYLTAAVGGSDYYTGAAGEPPGYWQGKGAAALGLPGQVDAEVMRRLYHEDIGPGGQVLGRRQRPGNYAAASGSLHKRIEAAVAQRVAEAGGIITPEEVREIRLRLRAQWRNRVPFYDYTFSVPKTVTVLWASLLQAAAEALGRAGQSTNQSTRRLARVRKASLTWSPVTESNRRPSPYHGDALPTELTGPVFTCLTCGFLPRGGSSGLGKRCYSVEPGEHDDHWNTRSA